MSYPDLRFFVFSPESVAAKDFIGCMNRTSPPGGDVD